MYMADLAFGPDDNLYVANEYDHEVLRFEGPLMPTDAIAGLVDHVAGLVRRGKLAPRLGVQWRAELGQATAALPGARSSAHLAVFVRRVVEAVGLGFLPDAAGTALVDEALLTMELIRVRAACSRALGGSSG